MNYQHTSSVTGLFCIVLNWPHSPLNHPIAVVWLAVTNNVVMLSVCLVHLMLLQLELQIYVCQVIKNNDSTDKILNQFLRFH